MDRIDFLATSVAGFVLSHVFSRLYGHHGSEAYAIVGFALLVLAVVSLVASFRRA